MKKWYANRNMLAIIGLAVLVVVAALGIGIGIIKSNQKNPSEVDEKVKYNFYQCEEAKYLDNHDDIGVMILDCDDEACFNNTLVNASVTSRSGEYVQGKGALKMGSMVHKNPIVTQGYFMSADISNYAKGSIHVSLYVSDAERLGDDIIYELTSSGTFDIDEMCWIIPPSVLKTGWNELYLGIEDARIKGEPDLSKINFYRLYTSGGQVGLDMIMDCVYATETPGMSLEAKQDGKTASAKAGYLMDCDSLDGLVSSGTLMMSTAKGEYKEGKGAIIVSNPKVVWLTANLKPQNISDCQNGKFSFWMYINDASNVKDGTINVELTSSGVYDQSEISWRFAGNELKTGWNEVVLNMSTASHTSKDKTDKIDFTNVNYIRIFGQNCNESLVLILDAFRVIPPTKLVPSDGMILNCDSQENMIVTPKDAVSLTTQAGEYKEGTGAFKNVGSGIVWCQILMQDLVDVSKYADGGVHLWLYVSDASKLDKSVNIELGSGGQCDVDEYQWVVTGLNSGWNELLLDFESAIVTGKPDLSNVNFLRIFGKRNADITVMMDDVRAVEPEKASTIPGMIATCDTSRGLKLSKGTVTTTEGEFKEGKGAYKLAQSDSNVRVQFTLNKSVDISEYADGRLHLWLYVDNPDNIYKGFLVELGNDVSNFYRWVVAPETLQSGWNELYLNFADVYAKVGEPNIAEIDYFRMLQYTLAAGASYKEMTTIVDDIRAIEAEKVEEKPVVPGMIADCDNKIGVQLSKGAVTTAEGEFKEGKGAYKTSNASNVRTQFTLENSVDISAYADGALHVWLYVDNPDNIYKGFLVELGNDVSNFYRWVVASNGLESGWNELELKFEDVYLKLGQPSLAEIDYFRILQYTLGANDSYKEMVTIVDDIRAVSTGFESCSYLKKGAIYQANKPMVIWGSSSNESEVKAELYKEGVKVAEESVTTANKEWELTLPGQKASYTSYSVKLYVNEQEVAEYTDILFGEVWLAAGQSNMQLQLQDSYGGNEQIEKANDSYLRIYQVVAMPDGTGASNTKATDVQGTWIKGNSKNLKTVSAVAYNFALDVRDELDVPIAILETSLGSTTIEAWLSKEMVDTDAELKAKMQSLGVYKTATSYVDLGAMYNSKIAPLSHVNIAGVIWYQGESNVNRASIYARQLDLLKEKWGEEFGFENDSMPFVFTQLAPYTFAKSTDQMYQTEMMNQMSEFYKANKDSTAMVTNYDLSLRYADTVANIAAVIHPTVKQPVGARMAMAALGLVYDGEEATAPILETCEVQNGKAILKFSHVGTGLKTCNNSIGVLGFAVCDSEGVWVNATAEIIDATTVQVYSDFVEEPVYVSYAYCDMNTDANLCASNGIPAAPFSTGGEGGLGSRNYLNCDSESFVVTSFATTETEVGHGEYKNLWTISNRSVNTFDSSTRIQGTASVKSVYEAGSGEVVVGLDLSEAGLYSVTDGLKNIEAISVKMKNADGRQKEVRMSLKTAEGIIVFTDKVILEANADFASLIFELEKLYFEDGSEVTNPAVICSRAQEISFYIKDSEAGAVWIDDIKLDGKMLSSEVNIPGMIVNCDSMENVTVTSDQSNILSVTSKEGEFKEGTGAFKREGQGLVWWKVILSDTDAVDISAYAQGGIHAWLYVSDTSKLTSDVSIEIGSQESNDVYEYQWNISASSLKSGWNELYLDLTKADGIRNGGPDLTKIKRLRVYGACSGEITVMLDDVRAVEAEMEEPGVVGTLLPASAMGSVNQTETTEGIISYVNKTASANGTKYRVDAFGDSLTAVDLSNYQLEELALEFWMKSSVDKTITIDNATNHLRMGVGALGTNFATYTKNLYFTGHTINLTAGEWTKVTLPLADAINQGNLTSSAQITWLRFLMMDLGQGTEISISDMKIVEAEETSAEYIIANASGYRFDQADIAGAVPAPSLNTTSIQDSGKTVNINYKEMTAIEKSKGAFRYDLNHSGLTQVDLSSYSLDELAFEFWMKSSENRTITLSGSTFLRVMVDGTNYVTFNSGSIVLKAGEWTKVTLNLEDAAVTGTVTNASVFTSLRFLIQGLGENTTLAVSDMKIVEVKVEAEELGVVGTLLPASVMGSVNKAETTEGIISYVKKTASANGTKYRVDAFGDSLTAVDLSNYQLEDLALEFWMKSSVDKTITIDNATNHLRMGVGALGTNFATYTKNLYFTGHTINLTAGEWTKVTLPLADAINQGNLTSSAQITWLRFLMMDLGQGTEISISDMKIVEVEETSAEYIIADANGYRFDQADIAGAVPAPTLNTTAIQDGGNTVNINYKEMTAIEKTTGAFRFDLNHFGLTQVDLSAYSLDELAFEFWMKSSEDRTIALSGTTFLRVMVDGTNFVTFNSGSIELKAGEWTKVTLNLADAAVTGTVTNASVFTSLRFLIQGLGENTTLAVSDMKIVK